MRRTVLSLIAWLVLWAFPGTYAYSEQTAPTIHHLSLASLEAKGIQENVTLPHQVTAGKLEGTKLSYRLHLDLDQLPEKPLGIYVPKLSMSGEAFVNGQSLGACAIGTLETLRCMHRPHLFIAPPVYWQQGRNEIRFEIYTDTTEINGLSSVWVGDAAVLRRDFYQWRQFISVDLLTTLSWVCALLGALGIAASLVLRQRSIYFWFALATLTNVAANILSLMDVAPFDPRGFTWAVSASRFVSVPLGMLTYLAWFDKLRPSLRNGALIYSLIGVILIAATNSDRTLLALLYGPLFIAAFALIACMANWSWKSSKASHWVGFGLAIIIFTAGIHDWKKLLGMDAFENIYLLTFAGSAFSVVLGVAAIGILASSLIESEKLRLNLEDRVSERTKALIQAHEVLLESEVKRAQTQGRELLLRDVHDGFGSQLVSAQMLLRASKLKQEEIETLLQECIDDLHLVIDISSSTAEQFRDMLLDFKTRFSRRLVDSPTQLHWDFKNQDWPQISRTTALHILRILQEALANALKHSKASNIWITASFDKPSQVLHLKIVDDGIGLPANIRFGRGLNNMVSRARSLGSEVKITGANPGTSVELQIGIA